MNPLRAAPHFTATSDCDVLLVLLRFSGSNQGTPGWCPHMTSQLGGTHSPLNKAPYPPDPPRLAAVAVILARARPRINRGFKRSQNEFAAYPLRRYPSSFQSSKKVDLSSGITRLSLTPPQEVFFGAKEVREWTVIRRRTVPHHRCGRFRILLRIAQCAWWERRSTGRHRGWHRSTYLT